MGDFYNISKVKKKEVEEEGSIIEEARRIEDENYEQAKDIRMQLGEAAVEQKGASEELKRQGETLENAKGSALNIHKEAKRGEELAEDIDREGSIFSCRFACFDKLCRWFKRDRGTQEVEEISQRKKEEDTSVDIDLEEFHSGDEFVPGQNKTDKELVGILNTVRGIRQEAESQSKEATRQKANIKDINKVTEESEKVIKKTDEHLKKID